MKRNISKFVYWTPRVLSIVFILFLALMSLDVFGLKLGFWQTILGLFMHNMPALILLAVLLVSWSREWVGGVIFILAGLLYIIFAIRNAPAWYWALSWSLIIAVPAFLIGGFFIANWSIGKGARKPFRPFRKDKLVF